MAVENYIPAEQFRYYYSLLPESEKKVYNQLVSGIVAFKQTIPCNGCAPKRIHDIYRYIRLDIPELFYIKSVSVRYTSLSANKSTALLQYRFNEDTSINILKTMETKSKQFFQSLKAKTDLEREKAIHDFLVNTVHYQDLDAPYSHEAPGALLYGIGVCEGISKAFKYLADRVGLKSIVVTGFGGNDGSVEGHAWNLCKLDDMYYHIDVTFDSTVADECVRYDYFNLSDKEIATNHSWTSHIPVCPRGINFYANNGQFFNSRKKLANYIRKQSINAKTIVFQLPNISCDSQAILDVVKEIVHENIKSKCFGSVKYSINYDLNRMVFQIKI